MKIGHVLLFALFTVCLALSGCSPPKEPSPATVTPRPPLSTPTTPHNTPTALISMNIGKNVLEMGQTTQLNMEVQGVDKLYGAEIHLEFDAQVLEVVDSDSDKDGIQVIEGSFLSPDVVAQNQADLDQGRIDYAVSQLAPREAVQGNGNLFTIRFEAKAPGNSFVRVREVLLSTSNGEPIPVDIQTKEITITVN